MQTGTQKNKEGFRLFYRLVSPQRHEKTVILIHGFAEHSGRWEHLIKLLGQKNNIQVISFDLRGHGRSEGKRGYIEKFDDYLTDVASFVELALATSPHRKIYLFGHSMGGLIAIAAAHQFADHLSGLIVSSPFLQAHVPIPLHKMALGYLLSHLAPQVKMANSINPQWLAHPVEVGRAYAQDPLSFSFLRPRWFFEMRRAQNKVMQQADRLSLPLLAQLAGTDYLTNPEIAKTWFARYGGEKKTLHVYEHLFHEIYHEDTAKVQDDLLAWLQNN